MLLLNPGPVTLTERVRRSLLQPDLCHREQEFFDLQDEALERLLATYALDPALWTALAEQVRAGLAARGIAGAIPPEQSSVVLRAYRLPPGVTYTELHGALKAGGFVIYAGQGDLSKTLFRISTMGNLTSVDIDRLLACFGRLLG